MGGAAIALAYDARRATLDVDAIFEPKMVIYEAAARVAEDLGLPDDWLNDGAKGFLPGNDPDQTQVFVRPSLEVMAASPEYLLAMKLLASRVEHDTEDIRTLYGILGYTTADEGLDLLERSWPGQTLPVKTQVMLRAMFDGG